MSLQQQHPAQARQQQPVRAQEHERAQQHARAQVSTTASSRDRQTPDPRVLNPVTVTQRLEQRNPVRDSLNCLSEKRTNLFRQFMKEGKTQLIHFPRQVPMHYRPPDTSGTPSTTTTTAAAKNDGRTPTRLSSLASPVVNNSNGYESSLWCVSSTRNGGLRARSTNDDGSAPREGNDSSDGGEESSVASSTLSTPRGKALVPKTIVAKTISRHHTRLRTNPSTRECQPKPWSINAALGYEPRRTRMGVLKKCEESIAEADDNDVAAEEDDNDNDTVNAFHEIGSETELLLSIILRSCICITYTAPWRPAWNRNKRAYHSLTTQVKVPMAMVDAGMLGPEILEKHEIRDFPTTVLYRHGKEINRVLGGFVGKVRDMIENHPAGTPLLLVESAPAHQHTTPRSHSVVHPLVHQYTSALSPATKYRIRLEVAAYINDPLSDREDLRGNEATKRRIEREVSRFRKQRRLDDDNDKTSCESKSKNNRARGANDFLGPSQCRLPDTIGTPSTTNTTTSATTAKNDGGTNRPTDTSGTLPAATAATANSIAEEDDIVAEEDNLKKAPSRETPADDSIPLPEDDSSVDESENKTQTDESEDVVYRSSRASESDELAGQAKNSDAESVPPPEDSVDGDDWTQPNDHEVDGETMQSPEDSLDGGDGPKPDGSKPLESITNTITAGKGTNGTDSPRSKRKRPQDDDDCGPSNYKSKQNSKKRARKRRKKRKQFTKQESGARLVHRKDVKETGIVLPVSRKGTCLPDALATIVSSIFIEEGCEGVQLPDNTITNSEDLVTYFREQLSPNADWVALEAMEEFLRSLNFKASIAKGAETLSKISVLTRTSGHFLIVCKLTKGETQSNHAVAYLANKRWLVDTTPGDKAIEVENSDIVKMTLVDKNKSDAHNHRDHKKHANELFKRRFDGAVNEIIAWYEITRA